MIALVHEAFAKFWRQHPALLYALFVLLAISLALDQKFWLFLIPCSFLLISFAKQNFENVSRLLLALLLFFGVFIFVKVHVKHPQHLPIDGIKGIAYIDVSSLTSKKTSFGKNWIYRGTIKTFIPDDRSSALSAYNIPYSISLPQDHKIKRPLADGVYRVQGILKQTSTGNYFLKIAKNDPWFPIEGSWSLAEYRFNAKKAVSDYISKHIFKPRSAAFLAGIATGEFDDKIMAFEFARFGLQHIMAISGFHFAIVAAILSVILRTMISQRLAYMLLMLLLTTYFIFLGCGPSITRAWASITIALLGFLLGKRSFALNSMGIAMMIILLIDPFLYQNIGFQFSFLTTAAILCFFTTTQELAQSFFDKRALSSAIKLSTFDQHCYFILASFRQAAALGIAVNLIALPISLYYFHKFPLLSLLYNLFFPFMVSISMLLLILGFLFSLVPFVGDTIHTLNSFYTEFMLNFAYNLPTTWDITLRTSQLTSEILLIYLCSVFFVGIVARHIVLKRKESVQDFAFM